MESKKLSGEINEELDSQRRMALSLLCSSLSYKSDLDSFERQKEGSFHGGGSGDDDKNKT